MLLQVITLKLTVIATAFLAATAVGQLPSIWNHLLNANGIFEERINVIEGISGGKHFVMQELKDLLNNDDALKIIYTNYLRKFQKPEPKNFSFSATTFKYTLLRVAKHNLEASNGEHSWEKGVNKFSDMSKEEFLMRNSMKPTKFDSKTIHLKARDPPGDIPGSMSRSNTELPTSLPESIDWRNTGKVSPPKDQGECNSCTTFATVSQLETVWAFFKNESLVELSPQEALDCVQKNVCDDGLWPEGVYEMFKNKGSTTDKEYPYEYEEKNCRQDGKSHDIKIESWYKAWDETEESIKKGVAFWGPVYAVINFPEDGFDDYHGGVWDAECTENGLHSVAIFGYGTENGKDFWLIRNSWGSDWGEDGYFKLRRNINLCNIQQHPRVIEV